MVPSTSRGGSDTPRTQAGDRPCVDERLQNENRQPEMSLPARLMEQTSREPMYWLVPDTGDDIVVSRIRDL